MALSGTHILPQAFASASRVSATRICRFTSPRCSSSHRILISPPCRVLSVGDVETIGVFSPVVISPVNARLKEKEKEKEHRQYHSLQVCDPSSSLSSTFRSTCSGPESVGQSSYSRHGIICRGLFGSPVSASSFFHKVPLNWERCQKLQWSTIRLLQLERSGRSPCPTCTAGSAAPLPPPPPASRPSPARPHPFKRRVALERFASGPAVFPVRALLALSAAVAVAFFRRKQSATQFRVGQFMAASNVQEVAPKMKQIDGHLHVWASPEEVNQFPYFPGQEPTLPGSAAYLVECMSAAGVDGALIIQPINHKFDHSYVSSVLQKYPDKFVGCCLADPTDGGGGVKELERLINKEGYRAVRFNPYLWPSGEKMTNEVGKAMFAKTGELGAVVGFMCFKGLLLHIEDIEDLCSEFPSTAVMIDHFGFCKPSNDEAEAWKRLLGLARFPQVYVKTSAFFRVSREPFPYRDTWPLVKDLLKAFGARRLLWGSDFPFIAAECGYAKANEELPRLISQELSLSESELSHLLGGTALQLFEGAWSQSAILV